MLSQCHSALSIYIDELQQSIKICELLSLVVCHALGTLHYQTPVLKLEIRVGPGALKIKTHQQIAVTYQQASVQISWHFSRLAV